MRIEKKGQGIRWKIVLTYCLLVFIATTILGVFMMDNMEKYYLDSTRTNMTKIVQGGTLLDTLQNYGDFSQNRAELQTTVEAWTRNISQEIFVVDSSLEIVASNNATLNKSAVDVLDSKLILQAFSGEVAESVGEIFSSDSTIYIMSMVFPIYDVEGDISGIVYLRQDISSIKDTLHESRVIFAEAMLLALLVTVFLGALISRSITEPINDLTRKAEQMAKGDFTQRATAKSDDEIGRLSQTFNYLQEKLNETLQQVSNEKNKLETILKHMEDGLIAIDLLGNIVHANPAARKILHIREEDIPGQYDSIIGSLSEELTLRKLREGCGEGASNEIFENGGNTYDVRYDKYQDEAGMDTGIIIMIQNITERTRLENMQMDFVANVSHELKTPLTTIKSYTETLLDGAVEDVDTAKSFLEIVDTEADRMNRLVRDLLQMSRMENQQEKWSIKESNLINLLKSAVMKVELTAVGKKQHLNCLFAGDMKVPVLIDRDSIEQVVLNVLSNAILYTQEGGRIDVDLVKDEKQVHILITDNGIGIAEENLTRVFERFFRADKARSRAMGGTGLGLYISKQIVENHGGTIGLESKEGKGTKVSISLPYAPSVSRGVPNIE